MENLVLKGNIFVNGAIWLAIMGGLGTFIYYTVLEIYDLFKRTFIISCSLDNTSEAFQWYFSK
jgi:hypothetical protein